jgi:hypothetical protein
MAGRKHRAEFDTRLPNTGHNVRVDGSASQSSSLSRLLGTRPASAAAASPWWYLGLSVAILAAIAGLGPYPVTIFPDDTMYPLVQGDLLLRGERPYVDYYSMHGPFPYLFSAAAIAARGISLDSLVLMQALGAVTLGLMMFVVAWRRVHGVLVVILAMSAMLLLLSCTPLGDKSWREFSCAMWYNSVGYVLYAIVFLYMLAPRRSESRSWRALETAVIGVCIAGAFCTKVTFFAPLVAVFVLGELVWPRERGDRGWAVAALVVAVVLSMSLFAWLGGSIEGYVAFLRSIPLRVHPLMVSLRIVHYTRTLGVCLAALVFAVWMAREAGVWRATRREFALAILMTGALVVSSSTAAQDPEDQPLLGVVPLGVAVAVASAAAREGRSVHPMLAASCLTFAALLLFHAPKNSVLSWVFSHAQPPTLGAPVELGTSAVAPVAPGVDAKMFDRMPAEWSRHQLDGLALLAEHPDPKGPVFVAADTTPLVLMSGRPYAKGQAAWWPLIFAPSADSMALTRGDLLADARWLLRDLEKPLVWEYLEHHLPKVLAEEFELVGERPGWELYRRRSD